MSTRDMTATREPERPVATASGFVVHARSGVLLTERRTQIFDATERISAYVRRCGVREGLIHVTSMHTTCSVFINEFQDALAEDILDCLERLVAREHYYKHNDPKLSDCDRFNADSHLRSMVLGHSITVQVRHGDLMLGQWQRILIAELDGPRERTIAVHLQGIA